MTTTEKIAELKSWITFLEEGRPGIPEVFKNSDTVAEKAKQVVSELLHVGIDEIESLRRTERIAWARQIAMVMTRRVSDCTLEETGRLFGKDHGTVLHAERNLDRRTSVDNRAKQQVEMIEAKLRELFSARQ